MKKELTPPQNAMHCNMEERRRALAWKRPRVLYRKIFTIPPLLVWIQNSSIAAVPPETAHVALHYLQTLEELKNDNTVSSRPGGTARSCCAVP